MVETDYSLLAVFVLRISKNKVLELIKCNYKVKNNLVFVIEDLNNPDVYILTFNGIKLEKTMDVPEVRNVISIHRKKEGNTLYTLNALNEIIKERTGDIDHTYQIDWDNEKFKDKFIITRDGKLQFIPTRLKTVINLNKLNVGNRNREHDTR